jgi:hypothetical protein
LTKKFVIAGIIIGIVVGSIGTYYSNYAFSFFGIDELSFPSLKEEKSKEVDTQLLPKTLLTNELQYTLVEIKRTDFGVNGEKPLEGGVFLITKIEIENHGTTEAIVYGKNWLLKDEKGRTYTPKTFDASKEDVEHVFSIRIPPGFKIKTNVGFEIPSSLDLNRKLFVADKPFESKPILLGIV